MFVKAIGGFIKKEVNTVEFSQYVIDAIASVDYVEKRRDYNAASLLMGAAENTTNESEITFLHFLSLLIKLLSLYSYQASSIIQKLVELEKDSMDF